MKQIQTEWIKNLASLKSSIILIRNGDTNLNTLNDSQSSMDDFIKFVEGYKTIIRNFPEAEDVIDSWNITVSKVASSNSISDIKQAYENFLNTLDSAIEKSRNELRPQEKQKTKQEINIINSQGFQIGDFNTQEIGKGFEELINKINTSNYSDDEKSEAKKTIKSLFENPVVAAILGGVASGLMSSLS